MRNGWRKMSKENTPKGQTWPIFSMDGSYKLVNEYGFTIIDCDERARVRHEFMIRNDKYQAHTRQLSSVTFPQLMAWLMRT